MIIYGLKMKEKIIKITKSKTNGKKYTAHIQNLKDKNKIKQIDFGGHGYEQYKDSTGLGFYTKYNHGDMNRRKNYFSRHSNGFKTKKEAIIYEIKKSKGYFNARILSHKYLW